MPALAPFPGTTFFRKGRHSALIASMGKRLVAEGCGKYRSGPGPDWTEADQQSYAAWQRKIGFVGADANGMPGKTSWDRLRVPSPAPAPGGGRAASPVPGRPITTAYRIKGSRWSLGYHTGADYAAPSGTRCVAVLSGSIVRHGFEKKGFGNFLVLRAHGFDYWYCHLSEQTVKSGSVSAGQKIGEVGSTGNSTGPHLHFEKRRAGGGFGSDVSPTW